MAVKIVRQTNKIALLGCPTSAASLSAGHEGAPAALRTAGLIGQLQSIGYQVADLGDDPLQAYKPDEESPRARNLSGVLAALEALKPRVEQAVKSGALPLIVSGDSSIALATVAGAHRYYSRVSMVYMGRDGGLHTPATTFTGSVDGMVVSHLTGRGAAELVRFWGEPQLVREPDLALFGVERLDPAEEGVLRQSPLRRYLAEEVQRTGAAATAKTAIDRIHGNGNPFVLHLDVDVIADFQATDYPGSGGLRLEEVREALEVFAKQNHLAAIEVAGYNPAKDSDGSGAKLLLGLLADGLRVRYETLQNAVAPTAAASAAVSQSADQSSGPSTQALAGASVEAPASTVAPNTNAGAALPEAAPGQAWSSESLEEETETTAAVDPLEENSSENSDQSDESDS